MNTKRVVITNVRILCGPPGIPEGFYDIHIEDGRIEKVLPMEATWTESLVRFNGEGLVACPGFIDLHVHGGLGADFMDATEEAFRTIGEYHAAGGTTAYYPTTATDAPDAICACIDMAARCREQRIGGVEILGVHVEGPYMAPTKYGCHDPGFVRTPSKEENRLYLDRAHIIRRITCAPEVPGVQDFIRQLSRHGITPSGGHSEATITETLRAIDNGLSMITHLYLVMSTIAKNGPFRIAGMLEATLLDDRLATELIADLKHVPRELLLLALKAKAQDKVCFTTDAMRGAGMPDGIYTFGGPHGTKVLVENGVAYNPAGTGFASSTVRMIDLVRNGVDALGLDLESAVRRASLIPAKIAKVDDRKGTLEPGKDADIVLLETQPRLNVRATFIHGERRLPPSARV